MSRKVMISCYGSPDDRERLAKIAEWTNRSQSEVLREFIRDEYKRLSENQQK